MRRRDAREDGFDLPDSARENVHDRQFAHGHMRAALSTSLRAQAKQSRLPPQRHSGLLRRVAPRNDNPLAELAAVGAMLVSTKSAAAEIGRVKISIFGGWYRPIAGKAVPARRSGYSLAGRVDRAGIDDMMARVGMVHRCCAGRRSQADQKAQGKEGTHRTCSGIRPGSLYGARIAQPNQ